MILARYQPQGGHVYTALFIGPDAEHLVKLGELRTREGAETEELHRSILADRFEAIPRRAVEPRRVANPDGPPR